MLTMNGYLSEAATTKNATRRQKKLFVRKLSPDRSQQVRHAVQCAFFLLNAWIGAQFILWVRYFESQGNSVYVDRPAGVDGRLPIAGLMNFR